MVITKKAIIALFGKPNVGKSTIFNNLQKNEIAITSQKPQTTRNAIAAKFEFDKEHEGIIFDTPGFHQAHNKLDLFLNSQIKQVLKFVTLGCFVFDATRNFDEEDEKVLNNLFQFNPDNKILIINKCDKQAQLTELQKQQLSKYQFDHIINISAMNSKDIDNLKNLLTKYCIHTDLDLTQFKLPTDEFNTTEIIRLSCINQLQKELPYSVGVNLNRFEYNKDSNTLNIDADIFVEKQSQKPIVIGSGAKKIKSIGIESRKKLLEIYDCKINLNLFVKVKNDWRNNDYLIKELGYRK